MVKIFTGMGWYLRRSCELKGALLYYGPEYLYRWSSYCRLKSRPTRCCASPHKCPYKCPYNCNNDVWTWTNCISHGYVISLWLPWEWRVEAPVMRMYCRYSTSLSLSHQDPTCRLVNDFPLLNVSFKPGLLSYWIITTLFVPVSTKALYYCWIETHVMKPDPRKNSSWFRCATFYRTESPVQPTAFHPRLWLFDKPWKLLHHTQLLTNYSHTSMQSSRRT